MIIKGVSDEASHILPRQAKLIEAICKIRVKLEQNYNISEFRFSTSRLHLFDLSK